MTLPLSYATSLPGDYEGNAAFRSLCSLLRELGFWGVELDTPDPARVSPAAVRDFLAGFGLRLSMLSTDATAERMGLSLSHPDGETRERSVAKSLEMIDWAAAVTGAAGAGAMKTAAALPNAGAGVPARLEGTGVIISLLKGGVAADPEGARERFRRSLAQIIPHAEQRSVAVLVEATNRYESSVANSLADAMALMEGFSPSFAQVLPDTFHMNIEEADMLESLRIAGDRFASLRLSDNNRLLPGFGAIDFEQLFGFLEGIGYMGRLAMEGDARGAVESDLRAAMARIGPLREL
jgi:sugar phosphate isomerase/epimerase